jgi:hypothetical protein
MAPGYQGDIGVGFQAIKHRLEALSSLRKADNLHQTCTTTCTTAKACSAATTTTTPAAQAPLTAERWQKFWGAERTWHRQPFDCEPLGVSNRWQRQVTLTLMMLTLRLADRLRALMG